MEVALITVISALVSAVACAGEIAAVRLDHFDENYLKTVPAGGGGILVGATVGEDDSTYLLKPVLFVPASVYTKATALCVETVSVDGSYWSHGELPGPLLANHNGALRVLPNSARTRDPLGTQWPREIQEFGAANIAVLASVGACGSQEERNSRLFVAVDRSRGPERSPPTSHYRLVVNPRLADEVQVNYRRKDGSDAHVLCTDAEKKFHNTAFSMVCDLEGPFADETSIELVPRRRGHPLASYRFDLTYAHAR